MSNWDAWLPELVEKKIKEKERNRKKENFRSIGWIPWMWNRSTYKWKAYKKGPNIIKFYWKHELSKIRNFDPIHFYAKSENFSCIPNSKHTNPSIPMPIRHAFYSDFICDTLSPVLFSDVLEYPTRFDIFWKGKTKRFINYKFRACFRCEQHQEILSLRPTKKLLFLLKILKRANYDGRQYRFACFHVHRTVMLKNSQHKNKKTKYWTENKRPTGLI